MLDLNLLRSILTLLLFIAFVGLCLLVIFRNGNDYQEQADIPLKETLDND